MQPPPAIGKCVSVVLNSAVLNDESCQLSRTELGNLSYVDGWDAIAIIRVERQEGAHGMKRRYEGRHADDRFGEAFGSERPAKSRSGHGR